MARKVNKKIKELVEVESIKVDLAKNFLEDAIIYGTYVATERALPDIRDGLKPVARRILYTMIRSGNTSDKAYRKSALQVGKVMGELHPHGDSSIYETMIKMSHYWNCWLMLVSIKGNNGNLSGDVAAAQRYTETRLNLWSEKIFSLFNKDSVDFVDNYDNTLQEPTVLPSLLPLLLINGTFGISVGFISSIPQHNPIQAIESYLLYCKKKKVSLDELIEKLEGPDFVTGGEVFEFNKMREFYETGESTMRVRGKTRIEGNSVIIYEIPTTLAGGIIAYSNDLQDKIAEGGISLASKVTDYTNSKGVYIEVQAKDGVNPKELEKELYAKTALQGSRALRFNVIEDEIPTVTNLIDYYESIHNFGLEVISRYYNGEKTKLNDKAELLEGLIQVMDLIDPVIDLIRSSSNRSEAQKVLMTGELGGLKLKTKKNEKIVSKFNFSEIQSNAILDTKLSKLSKLSGIELEKDLNKLKKEINKLNKIIEDPNKELIKVLNSWIKELKSDPYFSRKTKITNNDKIGFTPIITKRKTSIIINQLGYLKSLKPETALTIEEGMKFENLDSDLDIGWFSSDGNFNKVLIDSLGSHNLRDKGVSLSATLKLPQGIYPINNQGSAIVFDKNTDEEIVFVSELGKVKIVKKSEFNSSRKKIQGTKLGKDDSLMFVSKLNNSIKFLVLSTNKGEIKKVSIKDLPKISRSSKGVQVGALLKGDRISSVNLVSEKDTISIGGKKIKVSDLETSSLSTRFKKVKE